MNKLKLILISLLLTSQVFAGNTTENTEASDGYTCKYVGNVMGTDELVCFPIGHVCYDTEGMGDTTNKRVVDCWKGAGRSNCSKSFPRWPGCDNGFIVNPAITNQTN